MLSARRSRSSKTRRTLSSGRRRSSRPGWNNRSGHFLNSILLVVASASVRSKTTKYKLIFATYEAGKRALEPNEPLIGVVLKSPSRADNLW